MFYNWNTSSIYYITYAAAVWNFFNISTEKILTLAKHDWITDNFFNQLIIYFRIIPFDISSNSKIVFFLSIFYMYWNSLYVILCNSQWYTLKLIYFFLFFYFIKHFSFFILILFYNGSLHFIHIAVINFDKQLGENFHRSQNIKMLLNLMSLMLKWYFWTYHAEINREYI